MEWIKNNYDKWLHFLVGAMLGIWFINVLGGGWKGWLFVFAIAFVYKELVYDLLMKRGAFEWKDALFTMIAPTISLIIHYI